MLSHTGIAALSVSGILLFPASNSWTITVSREPLLCGALKTLQVIHGTLPPAKCSIRRLVSSLPVRSHGQGWRHDVGGILTVPSIWTDPQLQLCASILGVSQIHFLDLKVLTTSRGHVASRVVRSGPARLSGSSHVMISTRSTFVAGVPALHHDRYQWKFASASWTLWP